MPKIKIAKNEDDLPHGYFPAKRIDYTEHDEKSLFSLIKDHCIDNGQPLVISNMNKAVGWDTAAFSLDQLKNQHGDKAVTLVTNTKAKRKALLGDYIQTLQHKYKLDSRKHDTNAAFLPATAVNIKDSSISTNTQQYQEDTNTSFETDQYSIQSYSKYSKLNFSIEKTYAKDIDCPKEYYHTLEKIIPEYLFSHGNNDLFALLPELFQATNMMCYLGQDNSGTAIHRDLCGTMGHNIMTMGAPGAYAEWIIVVHEHREKLASVLDISKTERRKTKPGASRKKSNKSNNNFKSSFLESDRAWLDFSKVSKSDFPVQVILQKPGDLVIIPSRAYHQVRNVGVSIKVAWNRITAQTLDYAFEDQLPLYRIINRPEVYKCKAIVNFAIEAWYKQLLTVKDAKKEEIDKLPVLRYGRESFIKDSKTLLDLFLNEVIAPEWLENDQNIMTDTPDEQCIIRCDFCFTDIFHRYYHCEACNGYDLCLYCYSIGRSCKHVDNMSMRQGSREISRPLNLYKNYIDLVNSVFQEKILEDKSDCLNSESPSLSLICRRIESYRRAKGVNLNVFTCTHCQVDFNAADLAAKGISLKSIFKRSICPANRSGPEDVFVCRTCSLSCNSCTPLEESNDCMPDYDLVYFTPDSFDPRSWGAFFDLNVTKSCHYPCDSLPPAPSSSRKRKTKSLLEAGEVKKAKRPKQASVLSSSLSSPSSSSSSVPLPSSSNSVSTTTTVTPATKRKLSNQDASSSVNTKRRVKY